MRPSHHRLFRTRRTNFTCSTTAFVAFIPLILVFKAQMAELILWLSQSLTDQQVWFPVDFQEFPGNISMKIQ